MVSGSGPVLITTHTNPDGDAIGSSLALFHYFNGKGTEVHVIVPNKYPGFLSWMPGSDQITVFEENAKTAGRLFQRARLIFALDYNSPKRSGSLQEAMGNSDAVKAMVDHHPEPDAEGFDHVFSTVSTSSTAELLYTLIMGADPAFQLSMDMAACLFVGIMTDTGSFSFACNHPDTFRVTAALLETGINAERIHRQVYDTFSENRLRLLGYSLSRKLTVMDELATAFIVLSKDDLASYDYQIGDTEGLVNYALAIKGIVMGVLLTEKNGRIRLSFRSKGSFSVDEFARKHFAGGGHKNAAGGDSYDTLENTVIKLKSLIATNKDALLKAKDEHC